jgi:carbamate kinase
MSPESRGKGAWVPKVGAIVNFLKAGCKRSLINSPALLGDAMDCRAGTHFVGKI